MPIKYRERDLYTWGDALIELQEWADEYGDGVLQKWVDYRQRVGAGKPGHHVLCPEMPAYLQKISRAANRLDPKEQKAVMAYYSAQLVDGQRPKEEVIAFEIDMKIRDFKNYRRSGKINLLKLLNSF